MKNKAALLVIPIVVAVAYLVLQSFFAEEHARQLWLPELRLLTHAMMWENRPRRLARPSHDRSCS